MLYWGSLTVFSLDLVKILLSLVAEYDVFKDANR